MKARGQVKAWEPDYRHMHDAAWNRKPARLPLYEHHIAPEIMAQVLQTDMAFPGETARDYQEYYTKLCRFWREMTYDTVSFEAGICDVLPEHGAIFGGRPGPVQNRADFNAYPFNEIPRLFWQRWTPHLAALSQTLHPGMKLAGGCGYGVFEIAEDLVGYENLCLLQYDDPELFGDLFVKIGDVMLALWTELIRRHGDLFVVLRMGDDLGFKNGTLLAPDVIRRHIVPQYARIVQLAHAAGRPFLFHSCGRIFDVMEDVIAAGINAKHSNEDQIAPFTEWLRRYNDRIALFGGIDVDIICRNDCRTVEKEVAQRGRAYRAQAQGYALGSGNSIPDYTPVDSYLAMVRGAQNIRADG